jgi:hypothetical protein
MRFQRIGHVTSVPSRRRGRYGVKEIWQYECPRCAGQLQVHFWQPDTTIHMDDYLSGRVGDE